MTEARASRIPFAMLPFRDRNPSGCVPYVTWAVIIANVLAFAAFYPLGTDASVARIYHDWGLIPDRFLRGEGLVTPLTAMFVHGGWIHLALNMLFLRVFGDNLEAELGSLRFGLFYLACGIVAFALQVLAEPSSPVAIAGASGAVAGVMGGYLLMFPRARVEMLLWYVVGLRVVAVPAWALLGAWFVVQVAGGMTTPADGGVAFWAHVGGFLAGVALCSRTWRLRGGRIFWRRFGGVPPHPTAQVVIPVVRRRGAAPLPPAQPNGLFRR
ncbi:rhomboid family intramembrane serine protease [Pararhodobacter marinus]